MSAFTTLTVIGCTVLLLVLLAFQERKARNLRLFLVEVACLFLFLVFLHVVFGFPRWITSAVSKGSESSRGQLALAAAMYVCLIVGMLFRYCFTILQLPNQRRTKFDLGVFLGPLFASPIVFMPLIAAFQGSDVDLSRMTVARMMIFFVAFQNGFFWQEYFTNKQSQIMHQANNAPAS